MWENLAGQGYAQLAEGIIGTFYLPNLLIYFLFPINFALPLTYLVTSLMSGLFSYLLLRKLKLNKFAAISGSISYTFCASMVLHVQHINFIQAASLIPLIFFLLVLFFEKTNVRYGIYLSLAISQLFFTGFVQLFFYLLVILFITTITYYTLNKSKKLKIRLASLILVTLFSLGLASIQLLPSYELIKNSERTSGLNPAAILNSFPMRPKNLITYLNPFLLGNASKGSYNSYEWESKGIYWENTSYVSVIMFLFAIFAIYPIVKKRPPLFMSFLIVAFVTMLLSLGKYSPLHVLFSAPPLTLFRVPSRFILFTQFFIAMLGAFGAHYLIERFRNKKGLLLGIALVSITSIDLFYTWWNYNPIGNIKDWLNPPETAVFLKRNPNSRLISLNAAKNWNKIFTRSGWVDQEDNYLFFRNSLDQNLNSVFSLNQFSMFETLRTPRYLAQNSLLNQYIDYQNGKITISETAASILDTSNVKYIVSTDPVEGATYKKTFEVSKNDFTYIIYESSKTKDLVSLYFDYKIVRNQKDLEDEVKKGNLYKSVLVETDFPQISNLQEGNYHISNLKEKKDKIEFDAQSETSAILVLSQAFFPGWKAFVDAQNTKIYPANINSSAILLPAGKHKVKFFYSPNSFKIGALISIFFLFISTLLLKKRARS